MKFRTAVVMLVIFTLAFAQFAMAKPETLNRDEIPDEYKWNLADIYADWDAWQAAYNEVDAKIAEFAKFKGTLNPAADMGDASSHVGTIGDPASHLVNVLKASDEMQLQAIRVYVYAMLSSVEDQRDNTTQSKAQEGDLLWSRMGQATAWFTPELLSLGKETISEWIESNKDLKPYKFPLMEAFRQAEHVLSAEGEELLSNAGPLESAVTNLHPMLSTADADWPEVTLSDGTTLKATPGNYSMILHNSTNQADRATMMKAHFQIYDQSPNTFAGIYNTILQRNWFEAKSRNYNSVVEASLDNDAIPVDVYKALVKTAQEGSGPLRRYSELRQKVLGTETYSYYDNYLTLVETDKTWEYDDVKEMLINAFAIYGSEYQGYIRKALNERWIDVYENEGKESGAFSQGLYDVHPYIKLNHMDTMNDVFTIAHELGHSMHSIYSDKTQPVATSDYATFVAEVASTMNEALLLDYLLETEKDPRVRAALLEERINAISGTFYRQSMFGSYELKAHTAAENGEAITSEKLQQLYLETYTEFFGDSHDNKELYKNVWARIPHFYFGSPYYVYQYATSLSASTALHKNLTEGKKKDRKKAMERYIELISAGGSDHPVNLLANAGVDMTDPATYQAIVEEMDLRVTQLEKELKKLGML